MIECQRLFCLFFQRFYENMTFFYLFSFAHHCVNVFVVCYGVWMPKRKWQLDLRRRSCTAVSLKGELSYIELVDKLCESINVDRYLFDLEVEVVYPCAGQHMPPSIIKNDKNLTIFHNEISISIQHRALLCVITERKVCNNHLPQVQTCPGSGSPLPFHVKEDAIKFSADSNFHDIIDHSLQSVEDNNCE